MQYMKLSTSRDFRINAATLDAALQEQDVSQEVSAISYCVTSSSKGPLCLSLHLHSATVFLPPTSLNYMSQ